MLSQHTKDLVTAAKEYQKTCSDKEAVNRAIAHLNIAMYAFEHEERKKRAPVCICGPGYSDQRCEIHGIKTTGA